MSFDILFSCHPVIATRLMLGDDRNAAGGTKSDVKCTHDVRYLQSTGSFEKLKHTKKHSKKQK